MVYTTERFTDYSPMSPGPSVPVKKTNAKKLLRQYSETLYVKPKTVSRRLCAAKSKLKSIIAGSLL